MRSLEGYSPWGRKESDTTEWLLFLSFDAFIYFFWIFFFIYFYFLYCSGFCHTLKWNSHGFTCVPHPDPPSHPFDSFKIKFSEGSLPFSFLLPQQKEGHEILTASGTTQPHLKHVVFWNLYIITSSNAFQHNQTAMQYSWPFVSMGFTPVGTTNCRSDIFFQFQEAKLALAMCWLLVQHSPCISSYIAFTLP